MGAFVSIEMGNSVTKIVYGQMKKRNIIVKKYKLVENSEKAILPDGTVNINEVEPVLKRTLKEMKVRRAKGFLTISGTTGIVRLRDLPMVKLKDMDDMVRFEAEQFLPYNADAFSIDFRINQMKEDVSENKEKKEEPVVEVMVVAQPQNVVEEQVEVISNLRLNVERVTCYTDSIYTYFRYFVLQPNQNYLVVDLGAKNMRLTMFQGKSYFANTVSDWGIDELLSRYMQRNGLSLVQTKGILFSTEKTNEDEKEKSDGLGTSEKLEKLIFALKSKKTTEQPPHYEIDPSLEEVYDDLGREVGRMVEFFKTRKFGLSLDRIYLIGGGANLKDFGSFLELYHNTPVQKLESPYEGANIPQEDYNLLIPTLGVVLSQEER